MDVLTGLNEKTVYSDSKLQLIVGAWVMSTAFESRKKISVANGDVVEGDYSKQSIYALLYSLYRSMGVVRSETRELYEMTFNTWGYRWPTAWGTNPHTTDTDPQRFGKNAYTGLFQFDEVQKYIAERDGKVHLTEMGCGTGAGAHHITSKVLPKCTYEAVDMQLAGILTARRKFVPQLGGRLKATHCDATRLDVRDESVDIVVVNETHVTEMTGVVTDEDKRFFQTAKRILKPGGYLVWGNAIPDPTWQPCFDYLDSVGMKLKAQHDVTKEAVEARDLDKPRLDVYVDQCIERFPAFRIPVFGKQKELEARQALLNFARHPGTNLYDNMVTRVDSYRVVCIQKTA